MTLQKFLRTTVKKKISNEAGVTAIEYGLIAALVAVAIIVGVSASGTSLSSLFNTVATCI